VITGFIQHYPESKVIVYGFGVKYTQMFQKTCPLIICINENDSALVVRVIKEYLGYPLKRNENDQPFPPCDFSRLGLLQVLNMPIRASKGCFNTCPFCQIGHSDEKLIFKDEKTLDKEITTYRVDYQIKALTFWDPILNAVPVQLENVCRVVKRHGLPWRSNGMTVRQLTPKIVDLLADSGCYLVSLGIESFDSDVETGKQLAFEEVDRKIKIIKNRGIYTVGFFIIGLAGDTLAKSLRTIELARKLNCDVTLFSPAIAYPGTNLHRFVKKNGRFLLDIGSIAPGPHEYIHFDTPEFHFKERVMAIQETSCFKKNNRQVRMELETKLTIPWGPSSESNIRWKNL